MSDLISREEIRNLILEEADEIVGGYDNPDSNIMVNALLDLIDSCSTINPGEWISVKDRLPDDPHDFVLAAANGAYKNIRLVNAVMMAEYSQEEGWILEMYPEYREAEVTHWMPLPQLPEEEKEKMREWIT